VHSAAIERGAGGVEEITSDGEGTKGTKGMTEEHSSPQKEFFSSEGTPVSSEGTPSSSERTTEEHPSNRAPENSSRNEGSSSERNSGSSVPQKSSSDSSDSSSKRTEEVLGAFAEEMKELRKTMQFVRERALVYLGYLVAGYPLDISEANPCLVSCRWY
jgi:hypothetical protein